MSNPNEPNAVPVVPAAPLQGTVVPARGTVPQVARPAGAVGPQGFPSVGELLQGFRRCWLRAVTLAVLGAAAAAVIGWFGVPAPKARARALLRVAPEKPFNVFHDDDNRGDYLGYKKTQIALVKSRLVLNAALRQPKVMDQSLIKQQPDPVDWLERKLIVDYSGGPEILTISLDGDAPDEQTVIVNAVTHAFFDEVVNKEENHRMERLEKLEKIRSAYDQRLDSKRRTLRELGESTGTRDPANVALKQRIALEQLAAAQKDLTQLKSELRKLRVEESMDAKRGKGGPELTISEAVLADAIEKDAVVHAYSDRLNVLQKDLDDLRRVNPTHFDRLPAFHKAQAEYDSVKKALEARREEVRPQLERRLQEQARVQFKTRLGQEKDHIAYLEGLEEQLNKDVERLDNQARSLNRSGMDLESLRDEVMQAEEVLKKVALQAEALNVERDSESRIRPIEDAVASRPDQRIRQIGASAGGGFGALALILLGFTWCECRSLRINSPDEVVRGLGLKIMGTLPLVPSQDRPRGGARAGGQPWESLLLESVDSMRTVLLHAARTESVRAIMVTSALGGEGKTSLSCHLATSLARAGRKTLLIDGDLRKPSLHQVFDLPQAPGLCEVMRGTAAATQTVRPSGVGGLSVLPAGDCDEDALAALAQGRAGAVLAELRGQYDFIVVDSAPLLLVTDSLLLAQDTDAVLFSILRDVSRLGRVCAAHERLALLGVRTLGAVVTGVPHGQMYGRDHRYVAYNPRGRKADTEVAEEKA
jgi:capsular exopolysaccharide synthesis family protein